MNKYLPYRVRITNFHFEHGNSFPKLINSFPQRSRCVPSLSIYVLLTVVDKCSVVGAGANNDGASSTNEHNIIAHTSRPRETRKGS